MTQKQQNTLMINLWPDACRAQKWKTSDRALRLRVFSIAIYRPIKTLQDFLLQLDAYDGPVIESATEINADEQYTAVKALMKLLVDDVRGGGEVGEPQINKARQKRHLIFEMIQCLAIYPLAQPMGIDGAEQYVMTVIQGKFKRALALEELSERPVEFTDRKTGSIRRIPSQLDQLLITLSERLNFQPNEKSRRKAGYRIAAGHSEHQMKQLAGLKCGNKCKECAAAETAMAMAGYTDEMEAL